MVSKRKQPTLYPARRQDGNSGPWLCSTVANCDRVAVSQSSVDCSGCDEVHASTRAGIARQQTELEHQAEREAAILDVARTDERDLNDHERAALSLIADWRQQIGADMQALEAAAAAVVDAHTHTVFACDKHA